MPTLRIASALPLLFFIVSGCDNGPRTVPVQGVVMRGGEPFKAPLVIVFYPESDGRPSRGQTDAEGRFELKFDRTTKGAALGKHKVVIAFRPGGPTDEGDKEAYQAEREEILEKFGRKDTTTLTVEITHAESDLQLKLD
jgi:hypothetical protein